MQVLMRKRICWIVCLCSLLFAYGSSFAQDPVAAGKSSPVGKEVLEIDPVKTAAEYEESQNKDLESIRLNLDSIQAELAGSELNSEKLSQLRTHTGKLLNETLKIISDVTPHLEEVNTRLQLLGEAPKAGDSEESKQLAEKRKVQETIRTSYQTVDTQARLLLVRIQQIDGRIAMSRWSLFKEQIFERQISILDPKLWYDSFRSLPILEKRFLNLLFESSMFNLEEFDISHLSLLLFAICISIFGKLALSKLTEFPQRFFSRINLPSLLQKNIMATWKVISTTFTVSVVLGILFFLLVSWEGVTTEYSRYILEIFSIILFYFLMRAVIIATLRPYHAALRLLPLEDTDAKYLFFLFRTIALIYSVGKIFNVLSAMIFAPLIVTIFKEAIFSISIALLMISALVKIAKARSSQQARWHWSFLFFGAWIATVITILSVLGGFLSLAGFITSQIVLAGTVLTTVRILLRLLDSLLTEGLEKDNSFTRKFEESTGISSRTLIQVGIILSGLIHILLMGLTFLLLLMPWGLDPYSLFTWVQSSVFGIGLTDSSISFLTIVIGIFFFVGIILVTRSIKNWLDTSYLPHTNLDIGIRNSVRTAVGYAGYLIASVTGLSYVGLDLSSIAIVAGALSVGIGFGLQSIVNNFVSGLILLVERPIKAGDWIIAGEAEGYVRKISVRATEIETFDHASVIVPNSILVSNSVTNRTHDNRIGRIIIPVGVSYTSDPEKVSALLLECANAHPSVLDSPAPRAYFMNFGEYDLGFELRVYLSLIDNGLTVSNDLRMAIFKKFHENGITIPYPRSEIHLKRSQKTEIAHTAAQGAVEPKAGKEQSSKESGADSATSEQNA